MEASHLLSRPRRLFFTVIVMLCGWAAPLAAQQTKDFQRMLGNLGYEVTAGDGDSSYFTAKGVVINATHLDDEKVEMLYIVQGVPAGAASKVKYPAMLIANGNMASVFLMTGTPENPHNIALVRKFPLEGLTPAALRAQVDGLLADSQTYEDLWKFAPAR